MQFHTNLSYRLKLTVRLCYQKTQIQSFDVVRGDIRIENQINLDFNFMSYAPIGLMLLLQRVGNGEFDTILFYTNLLYLSFNSFCFAHSVLA